MATDKTDRPLTRDDVEQLLIAVGDSRKIDLSGKDLRQIDLSNLDLRGANLSETIMYSANLQGTNLAEANLRHADLRGIHFEGMDLNEVELPRIAGPDRHKGSSLLKGANLERANVDEAIFYAAWMPHINFTEASLKRTNLYGAYLTGASFERANLEDADLGEIFIEREEKKTNFTRANLRHCNLDYAVLMEINADNADFQYADLLGAYFTESSLREANLSETNLEDVKFEKCDLSGANLFKVQLSDADLSFSIFVGANFTEAILNKIDMTGANLSSALFQGAELQEVNFSDAILLSANLSAAQVAHVILTGTYITAEEKSLLYGKDIEGLEEAKIPTVSDEEEEVADDLAIIHIRINQEPLTTRNLTTIVSALTQLHTKCWLLQENRLTDLHNYSQTGDEQFEGEAPLIITRIMHNSPTWLDIFSSVLSVTGGIAALKLLIDAAIQAPLRYKEKALEIEKKRADYQIEVMSKVLELMGKNLDAERTKEVTEYMLSSVLELEKGKGLERP